MILIPLLPLLWAVATRAWQIGLINSFAGVIWGAFSLASFNYSLELMPVNQIPIYTAIYQVVVALSLALGALVGSAIVARWGFVAVMIASAAFRWLATGMFAKLIPGRDQSIISN
jgi:predicted MFS family arabinose efflux permease